MDTFARLDWLLDDRDLRAVWFARPASFAWLTGGSNVVDRAGETGVAAVGYTDAGELRVVTDGIEADRLREEQLPPGASVESYEWYDGSLSEAVAERSPTPAAADFDVEGFDALDAAPLRQPLTGEDLPAYRRLGRETAAAVEAVCRALVPDESEREAAADLRGRLAARGIDAPVALVGGAERARRYRHYTPTDAAVGDYALVSVTARRDGLHASCTRAVAFDPPAWLEARHAAAARVEATALAATRGAAREGASAGDVFEAIRAAYDAVGWDGEWRRHHQGGATGYAGREWIATPGHDAPVTRPMAYAWNPTVEGAKSEDTALVSEDGIEVLTAAEGSEWPTVDARAVAGFDLELSRPAVLRRD
jgi:Xaa-Pro aminopeptidase